MAAQICVDKGWVHEKGLTDFFEETRDVCKFCEWIS